MVNCMRILKGHNILLFLILWTFRVESVHSSSHKDYALFTNDTDSLNGKEQKPDEKARRFEVSGYLKYLPSVRMSSALPDNYVDHLLHTRLNTRWDFSSRVSIKAGLRTRAFYGSTVRNVPVFEDILEENSGVLGLNTVIFSEGGFLMHSTLDRLYVDVKGENWQLSIGRQRINWGINLVSNPNDLFNTYSFFDFDYEERPGTDAIRFQYFTGELSRLELAVAPGKTTKESVAAMFYAFNTHGYDVQILSGYYRNRWALGTGWAGNIGPSGFKGELTYFHDLSDTPGLKRSNLVGSISLDYLFSNGTFALVEYLYNQPHNLGEASPRLLTQPFTADNLSFTDHSLFLQIQYPINPILRTSLASFYYPSEKGIFLGPSFNYSAGQNIDVLVIAQVFSGASNSLLAQAGTLLASSVKINF